MTLERAAYVLAVKVLQSPLYEKLDHEGREAVALATQNGIVWDPPLGQAATPRKDGGTE